MDESIDSNLDFSEALFLLKNGKKVSRDAWDKGGIVTYLAMVGNVTEPYIKAIHGQFNVPWYPNYSDLFAEDWYQVL